MHRRTTQNLNGTPHVLLCILTHACTVPWTSYSTVQATEHGLSNCCTNVKPILFHISIMC